MNEESIIERLREIKQAAMQCLSEIEPFDDCVNWGGVGILSVEFRMDEDGNTQETVIIDEADPGCELRNVLCCQLFDKHGFNVSVAAEW